METVTVSKQKEKTIFNDVETRLNAVLNDVKPKRVIKRKIMLQKEEDILNSPLQQVKKGLESLRKGKIIQRY